MFLPEPLIFDDFLPTRYANELEAQVLDPTFPWNYNQSIEYRSSDNIGFSHIILEYSNHNAQPYIEKNVLSLFYPLTFIIEDKSGIPFNSMVRVRLGLFTKHMNGPEPHNPHTDYRFEHTVALYYLTDSDGPTYLYNERRDAEPFENFNQDPVVPNPKSFTLQTTVEPKKNRLLLFDGLQFHASSSPQHHKHRIALNINFL